MTGHGWDVKSVDWHPTKGLIVSGSKDHLVKLWDPRTAQCLTTLHGHKSTISKSLFQPSQGDLLATCARDQTCRIFDLRSMKDFCILRGHEKDISSLAWHPIHPALISTGGSDGAINHYLIDEQLQGGASNISSPVIHPAAEIPFAHEYAIWSMEYHPLGHILCTGSNDRITRFWTRPRPGESDSFRDRYHVGEDATMGSHDRRRKYRQEEEEEEQYEVEALVDQNLSLPDQHHQPQLPVRGVIPGFLSLPPSTAAIGVLHLPLPGSTALPGLPGLSSFDITNLTGLFTTGNLPPARSITVPPLPLAADSTLISQLPPRLVPIPPFLPGVTRQPAPIPGIQGGLIPAIDRDIGGGGLDEGAGDGAEFGGEDGDSVSGGGIGGGGVGIRRRGPLPSQKDSLREAQRSGFRRRQW